MFVFGNRVGVLTVTVQEHSEVVMAVPVIGLKIGGFTVGGLSIREAAGVLVRAGHTRKRSGVARIQRNGVLELSEREIVLPRRIVHAAEGDINRRNPVVELDGLLRIRLGFSKPSRILIDVVFEAGRLAHLRVSESKAPIALP